MKDATKKWRQERAEEFAKAHGIAAGHLIRIDQLSEVLDVPVGTLYGLARKNGWPRYKIGKDVRFNLEEILALVRRDSP